MHGTFEDVQHRSMHPVPGTRRMDFPPAVALEARQQGIKVAVLPHRRPLTMEAGIVVIGCRCLLLLMASAQSARLVEIDPPGGICGRTIHRAQQEALIESN